MTTSGVSAYNPAVTFIMDAAFRKVAAIQAGETPTASMYTGALSALNAKTKELEATGIHVWTEEEAILFIQAYQRRYVIGGTTDAEVCDANSYATAQLSAPGAIGNATVTLTNVAGFVSGNRIGIVLDSGFTQWTTINGAPAGHVVTLTVPLAGAATTGNLAWSYKDKIVRPLKVPAARRLQWGPNSPPSSDQPVSYTVTPLTVLSRQEMMDLPDPEGIGTPNNIFYSPQRDTGELIIWQPTNTANWALRFTWYRPIQDFASVADTADFPQEWINPLIWMLAKELAPEYDMPPARWQMISEMADTAKDTVESWDRESEPIVFGMEWDGR